MKDDSTLLAGYRILDVTGYTGWMSGRVFADLGAEVIKIEPPVGDPGRKLGPFLKQGKRQDMSFSWLAFNLGKKGITLKLDTPKGRDIFLTLASHADFILESFPPGYMNNLRLGYDDLKVANPKIIYTSISPFGQSGPYSEYKSTDIVAMAMGGFMYLTGDPDRPPLRVSFPLSNALASMQAVLGSLIALWNRHRTGLGQYVDVSTQESVAYSQLNAWPMYEFYGKLLKRSGQYWYRPNPKSEVVFRVLWPCRDGMVAFMLLGGAAGVGNKALAEWMAEEGLVDDLLKSIDWNTYELATASQESVARLEEPIGRFFSHYTKAELDREGGRRGIYLRPVATFKDIAACEQLRARNYWASIFHPEINKSITYPGSFAHFSGKPLQLGLRAPDAGEHNSDIYRDQLGLSQTELDSLKTEGII